MKAKFVAVVLAVVVALFSMNSLSAATKKIPKLKPTVTPKSAPKATPTPTRTPVPRSTVVPTVKPGATATPTPKTVAVTKVSIPKTLTVVVGQMMQLTPVFTPANPTNKKVSWSSSKKTIATVDSNGNVKGVAVGTATITVTTASAGKTAKCTVIVIKPIAVSKIKLNKATLSMKKKQTLQLKATITPGNATYQAITWTTSDKTIATVDATGKITALKAGKVKITATTDNGKKSDTCNVTVTN
jgi:uncharacterized protein YjdB